MKLDDFLAERTTEDLAKVTNAIAKTSLRIWERIPNTTGLLPEFNPSGERQTAIDVLANDSYVDALVKTGFVVEVASEEMATPVTAGGTLSIAMDPLDGSSNVETNNPVGSIFGFYSHRLPCSGRHLVGAAYVTFGPTVTLTFSFGRGVHRFVALHEKSDFTFYLEGEDLRIPDKPEVYGFGARRSEWIPPVLAFVASLEERGLKVRYCGTLVGDYNQVLKRGGIFAYPALRNRPQGKLRVLYETAPMAFITEQAGGYGSDGHGNILDIEPKDLSATSPAYLGTASLTREVESAIRSV